MGISDDSLPDDMTLAEDFWIDDGQLDGLTPQQCFVLGVEYETIARLLRKPRKQFFKVIHSTNERRLLRLAEKLGRKVTSRWLNDDWCELRRDK